MRVVASTDLSEWAAAIVPTLQLFATNADAEIHLITVVDPTHVHASETTHHDESDVATVSASRTFEAGGPAMPLESREVPPDAGQRAETRDQAIQRAMAEAKDALDALAQSLTGRVETRPLVGRDTAQAILGYAQQVDADLIALVTHAHHPVADLVFGGVTRRVIRDSERPVITVHPRPAD